MADLVQHPLSAAFPPMSDEEVEGLLKDIKKNGLREPVVIYEGMVLDGWHRVQMCPLAGVEIRTREFPSDLDPKAYVLSKNLHRRSLTPSQRAIAVVACNEWVPPDGWNQHADLGGATVSPPPATNEDMAKQADTSVRTIQRAKKAKEKGKAEDVATGKESAAKASGEPRKPSQVEKLKGELELARAQISHLEESIDNLTDQINMADAANLDDSEQLVEIQKLQIRIRALESQCKEHQHTANEWKREALALRRKTA